MDQVKIIGISGSNGSGKDTVGHILVEKFGYYFVSVTDLLRAEARKRGMPVDRESLRTISAEWRREHGLGVLIDKAVEHFHDLPDDYAGLAVASLRNPGEADRVHELSGTVLWLDADPRVRYARIQANASARNRAEEDNKTFEQFLAEEQAEMHRSGDTATLDMSAVKTKADLTLVNEFDDQQSLAAAIAKTLELN
ncbi:MAG TPA: AAA family ATPase [Candidatus Saccharimonadales bacterium]|nr:AAA family ATPase [Candidatus Saccharimonadales bacterium]